MAKTHSVGPSREKIFDHLFFGSPYGFKKWRQVLQGPTLVPNWVERRDLFYIF